MSWLKAAEMVEALVASEDDQVPTWKVRDLADKFRAAAALEAWPRGPAGGFERLDEVAARLVARMGP